MRLYIILLLLASLAFAQYSTQGGSGSIPAPFSGTILVNKSAPASVNFTDMFNVTIKITNQGSTAAKTVVTEYLGNVEPVSPLPNKTMIQDDTMLVAAPPRLTWVLDIPAGSSSTVSYSVKPKSVGLLTMGPTTVAVDSTKFYSNSLSVEVECTLSATCNESIGETPLNCPSKCGLNASQPVPQAPNLTAIPTAPIEGMTGGPEKTPPTEEELGEKQGLMVFAGLVVLAVIAALAYFFYFRKK